MTTDSSVAIAGSTCEVVSSCPLCGSSRFLALPRPVQWIGRPVFSKCPSLGIAQCRDCTLVFTNPRPSQAVLGEFYGGDTYFCHGASAAGTRRSAHILTLAERFTAGKTKRLLDYGCGSGFLLKDARAEGWDVMGFDIGQRAVENTRAAGLPATSNLTELPRGLFDIIVLNHVFEHIADQKTILANLKCLLASTGKVLIAVPNAGSLRASLAFPFLTGRMIADERYRAFPIHLFYFTRRTLGQRLTESGYKVLELSTYGLGLDEYFIEKAPSTEDARPGPHKTASANGSRGVPGIGMAKRTFFRSGLGENLLAIAGIE